MTNENASQGSLVYKAVQEDEKKIREPASNLSKSLASGEKNQSLEMERKLTAWMDYMS
jgi:hypothetical protein